MSNRKRRLRKRILPAVMRKAADSLSMAGEAGRAIPGLAQVQSQQRQVVIEGDPAIPAATGRTEISTYFTKAGGDFLLYEADNWVYLNLVLLDAGPVSVGNREQISPVLSGKGGPLIQGETYRFPVRKGGRVYITSNTVNRVRVTIEPVPLADQVLSMMGSILTVLRRGR